MKVFLEDNIENIDPTALEPLLQKLPSWRRETALKYKFHAGRRESALSYLLLCKALREAYGIIALPTFRENEHGKPSLVEFPHIHFNMSHCKTVILCAVSDRSVGVDVESRRTVNQELIAYTMSEAEQQLILQAEDSEMEFLRLWTAKEAVVKLTGEGLTGDIPHVLCHLEEQHISVQSTVVPEAGYAYSVAEYI